MTFKSEAYLASLSDEEFDQLLAANSLAGYHPETRDGFFIAVRDRFSGMEVLGLPGNGKTAYLRNLIDQDIVNNQSTIVVDPHGDLIHDCIAQMSEEALAKTYLLDMEDESHPFGVNIFGSYKANTTIAQMQAVDRVMHVFEVLWPEVTSQQYLGRYLRAATITLFNNPGSTLVDMHPFLVDEMVHEQMLQAVTDPTVHQFWQSYDELTPSARRQQVEPLIGRLESLFMGRSLVRNVVGQRETSIDFRKAIENGENIFIKLPIKTLAQDARLIGTLLIAQIHAAIFSFANVPEHKRPGFSLYVDEFQHFATSDFSEMFTEGRKFGVRVTVAHQYRGQLPSFLRESTLTARTKVCFQTVPEDAREMAHFYLNGEATVQPEDIDPHPVEHLLKYGSDDPKVQTFIELYLQPLQRYLRGGHVEIVKPGFRVDHLPFHLLGVKPPEEKVIVHDPLPQLNYLLYQVMSTGNDMLSIPAEIVYGFANCGRGFFAAFRYALNKPLLLSTEVRFPPYLVVERGNGEFRWTRMPENGKEWLYHFLFHLRSTMLYLADNPIGKKSVLSVADVAGMLTQLPKRAAFVRSGEEMGVIYTDDTPPMVDAPTLHKRLELIQAQTRQKYCKSKSEFEKEATVEPKLEPPLSRWEEAE